MPKVLFLIFCRSLYIFTFHWVLWPRWSAAVGSCSGHNPDLAPAPCRPRPSCAAISVNTSRWWVTTAPSGYPLLSFSNLFLQGIHLLNILFVAVLHESWWSCFFMYFYNKIGWWLFIVAIWCYWLLVVVAVSHPMTLWTLLVLFFAEFFRCSSMYCIMLNEKSLLKLYKIYNVSYYHLIELHYLITYL
jgi:hypothetical protein